MIWAGASRCLGLAEEARTDRVRVTAAETRSDPLVRPGVAPRPMR